MSPFGWAPASAGGVTALVTLAGCAGVACAAPPLASAQTLEAALSAELPAAPGAVTVVVRYTVAPQGREALPLRGVGIGGTSIARIEVSASPRGEPDSAARLLAATLDEIRSGFFSGRVEVPAEWAVRELSLVVHYRVLAGAKGAGRDLRYDLPVLVVGDTQGEALPGVFAASLGLPPDVGVYESFPTGARVTAGPDPRAELDLQVIPAVVTLRARTGGAPALAGLRLLDVASAVALFLVGLLGWRHLVREAGQARGGAERRADGNAPRSAGP